MLKDWKSLYFLGSVLKSTRVPQRGLVVEAVAVVAAVDLHDGVDPTLGPAAAAVFKPACMTSILTLRDALVSQLSS